MGMVSGEVERKESSVRVLVAVESWHPSANTEGFNELPEEVMLLEGVINELMDKVAYEVMSDLICLN